MGSTNNEVQGPNLTAGVAHAIVDFAALAGWF